MIGSDDSVWRRPDPTGEAADATREPAAADQAMPEPTEVVQALAYVPAVAPPTRGAVEGPSIRRSVAVVLLFLVGVLGGVAGYVGLNPVASPTPYPALAGAPEPEAAHALAHALKANDADAVANGVLPPIASNLSDALQPIVKVSDVTYLGTVEQDGRDLAGYIVSGKDEQNQKQIVGFVVDVVDDNIVGINQ
ncbi:MAG TPA: hypothetical protein VGK63_07460 [Candidatus Limnocylindrales bacterium]